MIITLHLVQSDDVITLHLVQAKRKLINHMTLGQLSGDTFCPVSMVMARPFGTRPAVLCFFTSRTDTTGMHTCLRKHKRTKSELLR